MKRRTTSDAGERKVAPTVSTGKAHEQPATPAIGDRVFVVYFGQILTGVMVDWAPADRPSQCLVRTGPPNGVWKSFPYPKDTISTTEDGARAILTRVREQSIARAEREAARWRRLDPAAVKVIDRTEPKPRRSRKQGA
jgi:hypothetical protein